MSLTKRFQDALLGSKQNRIGQHSLPIQGNQFYDPRLAMINKIAGGGLKYVRHEAHNFSPYNEFDILPDSTALGVIITITHKTSRAQIQFACPRGDKDTLLVSVSEGHNRETYLDARADIYDYTGNIDAANERLVDWLAEVAPEFGAEISAILEKIENPPEAPSMVCESARDIT